MVKETQRSSEGGDLNQRKKLAEKNNGKHIVFEDGQRKWQEGSGKAVSPRGWEHNSGARLHGFKPWLKRVLPV